MCRFVVSTVLPLIIIFSAFADDPPRRVAAGPGVKAAWQWTIDERIELRLNPALIRERFAAHLDHDGVVVRRMLKEAGAAGAASPFVVVGSRNPELLMPTELFHSVVYAAATEHDRRRYSAHIAEFQWNEETFWLAAVEATAPYRKLTAESIALQMSLADLNPVQARDVTAKIESLALSQCQTRFEALRKMRARFGQEAFDRFLYTAVAPNIATTSQAPSGSEAYRLRFIEGGCQ